jgi:uncharacterized membrane-anchored protein
MSQKEKVAMPAQPIDVVDGIADRSRHPAAWKYALLALAFLAWVAVLVATLMGRL